MRPNCVRPGEVRLAEARPGEARLTELSQLSLFIPSGRSSHQKTECFFIWHSSNKTNIRKRPLAHATPLHDKLCPHHVVIAWMPAACPPQRLVIMFRIHSAMDVHTAPEKHFP